MVRLLLLLLGTLSTERPGRRAAAWYRADDPDGAPEPRGGYPGPNGSVATDNWPGDPGAMPPWRVTPAGAIGPPGGGAGGYRPRRRRIPLGLKWAAALIVMRSPRSLPATGSGTVAGAIIDHVAEPLVFLEVDPAASQPLVQDPAGARSPGMPQAALDRVPGAAVWQTAKLGRAVAEQVAAPAPSTIASEFRPSCAEDVDEALWLAVSELQAHAAAQQRLEQRLNASGPIAARTRARAVRALHAADLITRRVLPVFQAGPLDGR